MDLRRLQLSELDMGILVQQGVIDRQASEIELQQCEINDQALSLLVHALDGNTTLKKLNLGHNPITDVGVALLADLLATNRTALVKLHLVNINITDRGIGYLADMLKHNQTLTALSLFQNRLTDRGVQQLAEALATSNTCLKYLYIQENMEVTDASVDSLINMFQYHQSLEIVDLQKCGLTPSGIRRLRQVANQKENFQLAIWFVESFASSVQRCLSWTLLIECVLKKISSVLINIDAPGYDRIRMVLLFYSFSKVYF